MTSTQMRTAIWAVVLLAQPLAQPRSVAAQDESKPVTTEAQATPESTASATAPTHIRSGHTLFIQPSDFGMALTAAILKKKVPVTVVADSTKADFWIQTTSKSTHEKTAVRVVKILAFGGMAGSGNHFDATVTAMNRDGIVVFAYNSQKENFQSAAQNVAKNLKKHIEEK